LHQRNATSDDIQHCVRCGLPSNYPDVGFDENGVCDVCIEFAGYRDSAQDYFQDMPALRAVIDTGLPSKGSHDCVVLFSGGKDSTYMIGRLVDMGLKVLAFTLDNGFLSKQAKANIERVSQALGVDHIYGHTPAMNKIFADSLDRFANVCNGCFKTIYTLGMQVAMDRDIPFVFTGLSRGQFFETRLTSELFEQGAPNAAEIDDIVLEARKAYHRAPDAVTKCLDMSAFETDEIFDKVRVVDFYRYCDVDLDGLYAYLDTRLPWVRPSDTGRSTNCLINDVGIYVHKTERGYHNYALPYSWDVRMGVKDRDAAMDELDDELDVEDVTRILTEVGYRPKEPEATRSELIAYYTSASDVSESDVRSKVSQVLPGYMLPAQFIPLPQFPTSQNGKIDRSALPAPRNRAQDASTRVAPRTDAERDMVAIWEDVLGFEPVGVEDNFFDIGGDSISAIRINTRARKVGLNLRPNDVFDALTITRLVELAQGRHSDAEAEVSAGPLELMPAQAWYLEGHAAMPAVESQMMRLKRDPSISAAQLQAAFDKFVAHHDGLRTVFSYGEAGWQAEIIDDAPPCDIQDEARAVDAALFADLNGRLDPSAAKHIAVALTDKDIVIAVHHLVIDAVSWPILLEDVSLALDGAEFPAKTASVRRWAQHLSNSGISDVSAWQAYLNAGQTDAPNSLKTKLSRVADGSVTNTHLSKPQFESARARLRARGASLQQGVLTALALTFAEDVQHPLHIAVEDTGRADPQGRTDVGRTIGWFTAFAPFMLPAISVSNPDPLAVLKQVQASEAARPAFVAGADVLRRRGALDVEQPSIVLNILDDGDAQFDRFEPRDPLMLWRDPNAKLRHALSINASISDRGFDVSWEAAIPRDRLDALAKAFETQFARLIAALPTTPQHKTSGGATQKSNLDKLAALMGNKGAGS
jgi:aryl carrier-like protein